MGRVGMTIALLPLAVVAISSAYGATRDDYQQAYQSATREQAKAVSRDNAWTTTSDVLKQARAAAASGNYDEGQQLSLRAYKLAQQSVAQAKQQRTAWRDAVPK